MDYEDLPYDQLRQMAFAEAEKRHDLRFFYDLFRRTPGMGAASSEGGSLGDISGSIIELMRAAEETFGEEKVGDLEPLFVANFATYLREHQGPYQQASPA